MTSSASPAAKPRWRRRLRRLGPKLHHRLTGLWRELRGALVNRLGGARVVGDDARAPVVCLTSHGQRLSRVHLTLESIAAGQCKPSRLVLWLDAEWQARALPPTLQRLQRRGLELGFAAAGERLGPHTKYFPYVRTQARHVAALVTADDDMLYPPDWLARLWQAHREQPAHVHCVRAWQLQLDGAGQIAPYARWPGCHHTRPSALNFATGVSGVIYPPAFADFLREAGAAFLDCCPRADDVWLHACALRAGRSVRQIGSDPLHFPEVLGARRTALHKSNVRNLGNDAQIRATYTAADLARLRQCAALEGEHAAAARASPSPR